jgi:predicted RNase H-like HicB family nuclease
MIAPRADGCKRLLDAGLRSRYHEPMKVEFTAVFRPVPGGYVAFVEELPGANTQGATLDEARANLEEAVALVLEANRQLAQEDAAGVGVIREPLKLTA